MRIIAGRLGGRLFEAPRGHRTHPMGDRVRGGLFSTLGDIVGLNVLDAFGGSGALAFEAISRGAASVVIIENDPQAQRAITQNVAALDVAREVKLIRAGARAWLNSHPNSQFDVVLCDPPYDNLQQSLVADVTKCVKAGGIFVLSWPGNMPAPAFAAMQVVAERHYGDAQIIFFRADANV